MHEDLVPPGEREAVRARFANVEDHSYSESPILARDGSAAGVMVVAEDVTDRRRAEERLRESEERFRLALQSSPIGMALVGLQGEWLSVNDALCRMLGYTADELKRWTFQDITTRTISPRTSRTCSAS